MEGFSEFVRRIIQESWVAGERWVMSRPTVTVVHEDDVETLLRSLNLWDRINTGRIRCCSCNEVITPDTFGCVYPHQGKIRVCCSALSCYQEAVTLSTRGETNER